jgi:Tfp pilus assembly protein PilF
MSEDAANLFAEALDHHQAGRYEPAVEAYRAVRAIAPDSAGNLGNLGLALVSLERWDEAIEAFEVAIRLDRTRAAPYEGLIGVLYRLGQYAYAEALSWQMLELFPDALPPYINLAAILSRMQKFEAARHLMSLAPAGSETDPTFQRNLGGILSSLGSRGADAAIAAHRKSVALTPDYPLAHLGLAEALLRAGHLQEGWEEYRPVLQLPPLPSQEWNGEPVEGRTVLIHKDEGFSGGFGDVVHLSRYVPLVRALGAEIVLAVPSSQIELMRSVAPGITLVPVGSAMPPCDFHCSLMALPRIFQTTLETIPAPIGYLAPPPDRAAAWAERFSALQGLRVGLIWAGHKYHNETGADLSDPRRIGFAPLIRLWQAQGVDFVSLQLGEGAREAALLPAGAVLHDPSADLLDFADTAAAMAGLDLIISVDTAGAHLAAALGKPTWIVLASCSCWRWLYDRADSPWYPTARLFRQKAPGAWEDVADRLLKRLRLAVQDRTALLTP